MIKKKQIEYLTKDFWFAVPCFVTDGSFEYFFKEINIL